MCNYKPLKNCTLLITILLVVIIPLYSAMFNKSTVYGDTVSQNDKKMILECVEEYRRDIRNLNSNREDLLFFPALKGFLIESESDSSYLSYLDWLLNNNMDRINSFDRLDEIVQELSRVYQFLKSVNTYKELLVKNPPVVHLEEFIQANRFSSKIRKGISVEITVDTIKLGLFSDCRFLLRFAKGVRNYDHFVDRMRTEPFLDILADMIRIEEKGADTLSIIKTVIQKIITSDERVRLLVFGYHGLHVAEKIC